MFGSVSRLKCGASLFALSVALGVTGQACAGSLPGHGHYVAGEGSINKANQSVTVKQSSTTGVIDWNKFSIGSKNAVTFDNGSGATLNRVTGGNLSTIAGSLHATGSLYLMNSSGVIVSGTGKVVTGGSFVATTGNISNTAFGDNDTRFKPGSGRIVNRGSITAGGTATLSGRDVADSGTIRASQVNLQAQNKLVIGGEITTRNADGSGGTIIATGRHIDVGHNASLSASGTRGGTVLIGGDVHGGAIASDNFVQQNVRDAATTVIAKGAQISADASKSAGGNIVIWSDGHTSFNGKISAEGQTSGGFAEVSSHDLLGFTGTANLTSTAGKTGELLLDPEDVVISNDADRDNTCTGGLCSPSFDTSILSVATLEAALATSSVKVTTGGSGSTGSQEGNISVVDPLTWSSGNMLQLEANNSIIIDAPISITGHGGLQLTTNIGTTDNGTVNFLAPVTFANTSSLMEVNGVTFTLVNSISTLASDITNNASGNYALANSINASGKTYTLSPISSGFAGTLEGLGNSISNFKIDDTTEDTDVAFFDSIDTGGTVRDLNFVNPTVTTKDAQSSAAVLTFINEGTVSFVNVTGGSVTRGKSGTNGTSQTFVGGLIDVNEGGRVLNSAASDTVTAETPSNPNATVIGGLVGGNDSGGVVNYSSASGAVTGGANTVAGGLVGANQSTGGFLGFSISDSYATGNVAITNGTAGGFIGVNQTGGILQSYATGSVKTGTGASAAGGFIGENQGTIASAYSLGAVTGGSETVAGGFAGEISSAGIVEQVYSTGKAQSGGTLAGFAGSNSGTVESSYFDTTTSGTSPATTGVVGLTTAQMRNSANMPELTFGTTAGSGGFVIVDTDGSFNNSGLHGATLPLLTAEIGSDTNIHIITNAHELQLIGLDPSGTYFLGSNVNLSVVKSGTNVWNPSVGFLPVSSGGGGTKFSGNFFGTGYDIRNLFMKNSDASYLGLLGQVGGNRNLIEDFQLTGVSITDGNTEGFDAGALAGDAGGATVEDVSTSGSITFTHLTNVGGLAGEAVGAIAEDHSSVSVSGTNGALIGGLIGSYQNGSMSNSYATGAVKVTGCGGNECGQVGGLVGGTGDASLANVYATGSVNGGDSEYVGGLIGDHNDSTLTQSYATGVVTSSYTGSGFTGGLVGFLGGAVSQSFATGAVSAEDEVGGLAGRSNSPITDSYAMGAVKGGAADAGGLVGDSVGNIADSYATGTVSGQSAVGGLVGNVVGGTITDTYWDTQTSGLSAGFGHNDNPGTIPSVTGKTTSQLQSALPSGFSTATWKIVAGKSFPYLAWQVASGTPEVVSGTISGASSDAGLKVDVRVNGKTMTPLIAMASGANGYYYELLAPGSISSSGSDVLAYLASGSSKANYVVQSAKGSLAGVNLVADTLEVEGSATSETSLLSAIEKALGTNSASVLYTKTGAFTSGIDLDLNLSAGSFSINHAIDIGTGALTLDAAGSVKQTNADRIEAKTLRGKTHGMVRLTSTTNDITDLGSFSTGGAHAFEFKDDHALTVDGAVNAGTAALHLTTRGSGNNLAIDSTVTGGSIDLVTTGKATESSAGAIVASTILNVTADTGIDLASTKNKIKKLGTHKTKTGPDKVTL